MFKKLLLSALCACLLCSSAMAANFTATADALHDLGLFAGTTTADGSIDYALDDPCTRAEAAVMLVRLLGKEDEAQQGTYETPFTDLYEWQKPYVGWLYANGLTTGTGATTFSPEEACTAPMYASFVLRALGYSDGEFSYNEAVTKATTLGFYDASLFSTDDFRRDEVAAMSFLALFQTGKSTDILLTQLVDAQAVDADQAQVLLDQVEAVPTATELLDTISADGFDATLSLASQVDDALLYLDGAVQRWQKQLIFEGKMSLSIDGNLAQTFDMSVVYYGNVWQLQLPADASRYSATEIANAVRASGLLEFLQANYLESTLVQQCIAQTSTGYALTTDKLQWQATVSQVTVSNAQIISYAVQSDNQAGTAYTATLSDITAWDSDRTLDVPDIQLFTRF